MSKIKSYKQIQKELFSSEFNKFRRKNDSLDLKETECKRKKYLIITLFIILIIILFSVSCIIFWESDLKKYLINDYFVYFFVLLADIILFSFIVVIEKKYKDNVKEVILPELLKYFGDFEFQNKRNSNDINYIRNLKIFDEFDRYRCDNRLSGIYNGVKLDFYELCLEKIKEKKNGKNKRIPVFNGILIKVPCVKKFSGKVIIKRKPYNSVASSTEFGKYYDINYTDEAESKYLITVPFMNNMVNIANNGLGIGLNISFENEYIHISLENNKILLNIPLLRSSNNIKNYRLILLELIFMLSIIDSLKLDRNIGF